eukprot:3596243-Pyramimonas_sp.AAC.1
MLTFFASATPNVAKQRCTSALGKWLILTMRVDCKRKGMGEEDEGAATGAASGRRGAGGGSTGPSRR